MINKILAGLLIAFTFLMSCNPIENQAYINEIKGWQDTLNIEFSNKSTSPLDSVGIINFSGLDFYPINHKMKIDANFERTPLEQPFLMKTTTDRLPIYVKFGIAKFIINGIECKLNVYQNQEFIKKPGFEDYLFIPFMDKTTGGETYSGGRYLDLKIPKSDKIVIDFNRAYNPYCAYNHKYSCPIPPFENNLPLEIEAGVKNYVKK
jgi:uncharacterized protein